MTDAFHKLPLMFDQQRLTADLNTILERPWLDHVNNSVHNGEWNVLPLRSVDGGLDNGAVVESDPERYQNTAYLEQCDYFQEILTSLNCTLVSARLMRLKAGGKIRRHNDNSLSFEDGCARLHIPIQTHQQVTFHINDHPIHFAVGECWYMNANYFHQVENNSPIDRVHLVIDCMVNNWLKTLFFNSGYETTAIDHPYGSAGINDDNVWQIIDQLIHLNTPTANEMAQSLQTKWQQNKRTKNT
ncbi:aspartyl/asparaginyl beta-hydroxylase domain-containing protein [Marinomonas algicola]|uniref:aspartyl/asparaginyl beta-hydroxylase domain-containing protein n=1 Tax=Marinomonas algicola TaxID=2773454 RepID=UPI0017499C63|nr:aspartyl/asparaginyl beta-hydroxylase domain-containing protein [Marinomonas algicola]